MKFNYTIEGMHCSACIKKISEALSPHVQVVTVTLEPPRLVLQSGQEPEIAELNKYLALVGKYQLSSLATHKNNKTQAAMATTMVSKHENPEGLKAYYPIFLITAYLVVIASLNNFHWQSINWQGWMGQFMAGFFFVFSAFKLLDIHGFAEGYATYDLLAKRWPRYGLMYPFIELGLAILYMKTWLPVLTNLITIVIMGVSSVGVIISLVKKQKIQCACLGTLLNVPLSSITLIEDLTMVGMAAISLMMK